MSTRALRACLLLSPAAVLRHTVLLATGALIVVPFVWMVSLSIKAPGEIFRSSFSFWPVQFYGVENYTKAVTQAPLPRYVGNGVMICALILALQILVCAPCAYALATAAARNHGLQERGGRHRLRPAHGRSNACRSASYRVPGRTTLVHRRLGGREGDQVAVKTCLKSPNTAS